MPATLAEIMVEPLWFATTVASSSVPVTLAIVWSMLDHTTPLASCAAIATRSCGPPPELMPEYSCVAGNTFGAAGPDTSPTMHPAIDTMRAQVTFMVAIQMIGGAGATGVL